MCREKNHCEQDAQVDLCFLNFSMQNVLHRDH